MCSFGLSSYEWTRFFEKNHNCPQKCLFGVEKPIFRAKPPLFFVILREKRLTSLCFCRYWPTLQFLQELCSFGLSSYEWTRFFEKKKSTLGPEMYFFVKEPTLFCLFSVDSNRDLTRTILTRVKNKLLKQCWLYFISNKSSQIDEEFFHTYMFAFQIPQNLFCKVK